ncbi:MAG: glycosyltransferase family 4 protein, partial [Planctomycetota bacterium]|nr:glycosyltransferase family 4 protein [Planctomycetota bacterium]
MWSWPERLAKHKGSNSTKGARCQLYSLAIRWPSANIDAPAEEKRWRLFAGLSLPLAKAMKILFALDNYGKPSGGADRAARAVQEALVRAGHEVQLLTPDFAPGIIRDGDWLTWRWNRIWHRAVRECLEAWQPDLLLTQNRLTPASVFASREVGVPCLIFFHGYRCLSPTFFEGEDALTAPPASFWRAPWRCRLKWPLVRHCLTLYAEAYRSASAIVANSHYSAAVIKRFYDREAEVLYPIFDLTAPENRGAVPLPLPEAPILFVKPQRIKGLAIAAAVARLLPQRRLRVVGRLSRESYRAFRSASNVELLGWVDDISALYRNSSLLLAPSQIPEPFGRVIVEAALHGVPCVASASGGIPEA